MKQSPKPYDIDESSGEYTSAVLNTQIYSYDPEDRDL